MPTPYPLPIPYPVPIPLLSAFAYDDDVVAAPTAPLFAVKSVERGFREPSVSWPVPEVAPTVRAPVSDVRGAEGLGDSTAEGVRREQLVGEPGAVGSLGDPGGLLEAATGAVAAAGSELMLILVYGHLTTKKGWKTDDNVAMEKLLASGARISTLGSASGISVWLWVRRSAPPSPQRNGR